MRIQVIIAAAALTGWSAGAAGQTKSADAIVQSFGQCRTIDSAAARLECFDQAAQALEKAVRSKDVTIVDRQEVRTARRSLFGFTAGLLPIFGGSDHGGGVMKVDVFDMKVDVFDQLDTTIVSAQPLANGNVQLHVAEANAVWVTSDPMPFPPRPGAKVTIKRGAIGNYFINVQGQRGVRGTRLR